MADNKLYVIDQNTGKLLPIKLVDPGDGSGYSLATSGSGGGGSSDASAANQTLQITQETALNTAIGAKNDSEATTDTGVFSLIALVKRLLNTKLKVGQQTKANSLSVVPASDYQSLTIPLNANPALSSVTANNTDLLAATDVSNYKSGSLQILGVGGGATLQVQFSVDGGTTWVATVLYPDVITALTSGVPSLGANATGIWNFDIPAAAQMRIRTVTYTSGTISAALGLSSVARPRNAVSLVGNRLGSSIVHVPAHPTGNDSQTVGDGGLVTAAVPMMIGGLGTTSDRQRGITTPVLLASSARTTNTNSTDQTNFNHRGLLLMIDVSNAGTGSITPAIQVKDSISGNYKTIWTAAAPLTANGTYVYAFYPGELNTLLYTEALNAIISRTWRLAITHNNANSITYSASADMQL